MQDPVVHHNYSPYSAFDNNPVFWADPSGADSNTPEMFDAMGRNKFDSNGLYITPDDRGDADLGMMDFMNTERNKGGGGGPTFDSLKALEHYIYSVLLPNANAKRFLISNNGNGSFTVSWMQPFSYSSKSTSEDISEIGEVVVGMKRMSETLYFRIGTNPWMAKAQSQLGVKELTGNNDGKAVEMYLKSGGLGKGSPWCGAFVNWTLSSSGINVTGVRGNPNLALNWRGFGTKINKPALGAIATKTRKGGGHVGFVAGIAPNGGIVLLGGNQSDSVNYTVYSPGTIFQYNFPSGYTPNYNLPTLNISQGNIKEN